MQILPSTAADNQVQIKDVATDPEQNIYCGAQVLAHLRDVCGGDSCALAAYNTGINSEREQAGKRYVSKIDYHRAKLETL